MGALHILRDIKDADASEKLSDAAELTGLVQRIISRQRSPSAVLFILKGLRESATGETVTQIDNLVGELQYDLNIMAAADDALRAEMDLAERMASAFF